MIKGELLGLLERFSDDTPVHISYPSNDYWGTVLAPEAEQVDLLEVKYSDYHRTDALADEDAEKEVIVIYVQVET